MDWQLLVVAVAITLSTLYLARRCWRTWRGRGSGCATCSCGKQSAAAPPAASERLISLNELTLRLRRRDDAAGR